MIYYHLYELADTFDGLLLTNITDSLLDQIDKRIMYTEGGQTIYGIFRSLDFSAEKADSAFSNEIKCTLLIEQKPNQKSWMLYNKLSLYSKPAIDLIDFSNRIAPEIFQGWKT